MFGIDRLRDFGFSRIIGCRSRALEGVACGLIVALAAFSPAGATPSAEDLEVRPGHVSPNGDGVQDTATLQFTPRSDASADSLDVLAEIVRLADAVVVDSLIAPSRLPVDVAVAVVWDPGALLADGEYGFDVTLDDGTGAVTERVVCVSDQVAPVVTFGAIAPNPFDPTSAPPDNELNVPVEVVGASDDRTTVSVLNAALVAVDTLGVLAGAVDTVLVWDGLTAAGAARASGRYTLRAHAADLAGNEATVERSFLLDHDGPTFADDNPAPVYVDAFPVVLAGSSADNDVVVSVLASVDGGAFFAPSFSTGVPADSVTWEFTIADSAPVPSSRDVTVRAEDAAGHVAEVTYTVGYDTPFPVADSTVVVSGDPVPDGGRITLRSYWNRSGLDVSADFSALDSGWSAGRESVVETSPGVYRIIYDVTPSNTRAPGASLVLVSGDTGFVIATDSLTVTLEDRGPGGKLVGLDRNVFDPETGDRVAIIGESAASVVEVRIFNLAGNLVRRLQGNGQVLWDGHSETGATVASGVYFLRVTVDGLEEIRKVAVKRGGGA
ncbi:MAG: T9SS type A sorting domain-containing protein [Gemmatimonadetes bacterium]|nr:T9SS type A sorting domain-containing protein [Gemmatimonadota bacterium]